MAYLSDNVDIDAYQIIHFDTEEYDNGNNYSPSTGTYTVPYDGHYLIHAWLYAYNNDASHYVKVNGDAITWYKGYDDGTSAQSATTSVVLHLLAGQQITVIPDFTGTISGSTSTMNSAFGMTLLYPD